MDIDIPERWPPMGMLYTTGPICRQGSYSATIINLMATEEMTVRWMCDLMLMGTPCNACILDRPIKGLSFTPYEKRNGNWKRVDIEKLMLLHDNPDASKRIVESGATIVLCDENSRMSESVLGLIDRSIEKRNPIYIRIQMDGPMNKTNHEDISIADQIFDRCKVIWGAEKALAGFTMCYMSPVESMLMVFFPPEMVHVTKPEMLPEKY